MTILCAICNAWNLKRPAAEEGVHDVAEREARAEGETIMTIRYGVERYAGYFPNGQACYGVVDLTTGAWTRDAAGEVFRYTREAALEVAKSLNAPRYVCECGYQVREDDREFHNSMVCPLTAPKTMDEDECPSCGAMVPLRDFGLHCCDYSDDPRPSDAW